MRHLVLTARETIRYRVGELFAGENSLSVQPYQAGTWLGGIQLHGRLHSSDAGSILDERLVRVAPAASCAAVPSTALRLGSGQEVVLSVRGRFLQ